MYTLEYCIEKVRSFNYMLLKNNYSLEVCEHLENAQTNEELCARLAQLENFIIKKIRK